MSTVDSAEEGCASCGIAALDNVKLKKCACKLVQYCGVECQRNHRPHHKKACKKRLAEIREDLLFMQPDGSHRGECPICCLPLPLDVRWFELNACCCKIICIGCVYANMKREIEAGLEHRCAFCREPATKTGECEERLMKRVEANDPVALCKLGSICHYERGQYDAAFEHYTKAAE